MRILAIMLSVLMISPSFAALVNCYAGNKKIYSAYVTEMYFEEGMIVVRDAKTNRDVIVSGQCIIRI